MHSRFNYHDFIAYVIPGLLPCLVGILIIFARGHYRLFFFMQTFVGLILLLLIAYLVGHFIQAFGAWVEKKVFFEHGFHPGEAYFRRESGMLPAGRFDKLLAKCREKYGFELTPEELQDPKRREACFNEIRWGIGDGARGEYIRTIDAYYDMYRGLFVSFILILLMSFWIGSGLMQVPASAAFYQKVFLYVLFVGAIIAAYISWRRAQDYLQVYTGEVANAFLEK
jgi:hypothetical protein